MSQPSGPRIWYPCENVVVCINDDERFNFKTRVLMSDDEDERHWQLRELCTPLLTAVLQDNHFPELDTQFSALFPNMLSGHPGSVPSGKPLPETKITTDILRRLPNLPQRMFDLAFANSLPNRKGTLWDVMNNGRWNSKFILPEARDLLAAQDTDDATSIITLLSNYQDITWANLYVTTFIDTNSVILAAKIATRGSTADLAFAQEVSQYVNILAELIDVYEHLNEAASFMNTRPFSDPSPSVQALRQVLFPEVDEGHAQGRSVLRVFLWTAWQRSVMLYFYYVIRMQLLHGYSSEWSSLLAIQGIERLSELDSRDYRGDGIDYMCNWAFEILRTSRSSLSLDFRTMISRFDSHFHGRSGRCTGGSDFACRGDVPESCQRFTGAETKSQSAHALTCSGSCRKIIWSEESYRKIKGARAVDVNNSNDCLQYCQVSPHTMAISHVCKRHLHRKIP